MKALLIKEFRENSKWLVVGLIVFSFVAYCWLPETRFSEPNSFGSVIDNGLSGFVGFLGGIYAFSLGLLQSAFDLRSGTRAYLQHRGVKSSQIVIAKLITGFTIYATAILIPMSLLAMYLGWFGIQTIPVRPFQVVPVIVAAFFAFILHPTAIFCLSRCASWWGTKTLPVIATVAVAGSIFVYFSSIVFSTNVWLWLLPVYIFLLAITCWSAVDAWDKMSLNPPAAQFQPNGWRVNSTLILGSLVCIMVALQFLAPIISIFYPSERRHYELKFDLRTGEPWAVSTRPEHLLKSALETNDRSSFGGKIEAGIAPTEFSLIPKKMKLDSFAYWTNQAIAAAMFRPMITDLQDGRYLRLWTFVIDQRGYLLRYSVSDRFRPQLDSIIARDGVHQPKHLPGNPFSNLRDIRDNPSGLRAFYDDRGVYALQHCLSNASEMRLNTLVEGKVNDVRLVTVPFKAVRRLTIVVDGEIREYQLLDEKDSEDWTIYGSERTFNNDGEVIVNRTGEQQTIRAKLIHTIALPTQVAMHNPTSILRTEIGYVVMVDSYRLKHFWLGFDGITREILIPNQNGNSNEQATLSLAAMPPVLSLIGCISHYVYRASRGESADLIAYLLLQKSSLVSMFVLGSILVLISMGIVNRMLRKRGIAGKKRWAWLLTCILLGIATPLVVASIYAVRVREKCASCGQLRSVDLEHCEVCNAGWPISEQEGIEVFDTDANLIGQGEVCAGV